MCECLELSRSGHYEWKRRGLSQHAQKDEGHKTLIGELHRKARGTTVIARTIITYVKMESHAAETEHCD